MARTSLLNHWKQTIFLNLETGNAPVVEIVFLILALADHFLVLKYAKKVMTVIDY